MTKYTGWLMVGVFSLLLAGCDTLGYYRQGIGGQVRIWRSRQPIAAALQNPNLSPLQKKRLEAVTRIRQFAQNQLSMSARHQYETYADLGRRYVAWAVMAAPAYSVMPHQWCYPLLGCLDYHGFFNEDKAQRYAQALKQQGMDVFVAPVQAYSTLGWFRDPVFSSFLNMDEVDLAQLIFHELAHQQLFFKGDTAFNESFANAVAEVGLQRYADRYQLSLQNWQLRQQMQQQVMQMLMQTRNQLQAVYVQGGSITQMQKAKSDIIHALQVHFQRESVANSLMRASYSDLFHSINNASLASVADYHHLVPDFMALLHRDHEDLPLFFKDCASLKLLHPAARRMQLHQLAQSPLPTTVLVPQASW